VSSRRLKIAGALLAVCAWQAAGQSEHQHHPPQSSDEYAKVLNDPERDAWQKPHEVVMALQLRPDEAVADIGAGTGYFSQRFARHAGTVYAVDVDEKLLAIAAKGAPANHKTVLALPDDPRLPSNSVDTIFFCDVIHHIGNRKDYYGKLNRALKPGGRIVVIDFEKKPTPVGPPAAMRLDAHEVESELEAAGFRKSKQNSFLPYQYFLVFERK
jgi:arsenite methyltransferase